MCAEQLIPPNQKALKEALELSQEIISNIELSQIPLANIVLKSIRLARLLNDFEMLELFELEASGYPTTPDGVPHEKYNIAVKARRVHQIKDTKENNLKSVIYTNSIGELEESINASKIALQSAQDPNVSVSSSNPDQFVWSPIGNREERTRLTHAISIANQRLSSRKSLVYNYSLNKHYEIKYSGIADDIFSRIRENVDNKIGKILPEATKKFSSVYDNLLSENPEDWSNAVHSCRRILSNLADKVYPPEDKNRTVVNADGETKKIKLGKENYINRLIAFIEDNSSSERFREIVGSHLKYIGERIDSVFLASQKGSHTTIVKREEADRYVVYTYMLIGDILSLTN